MPEYKFVILHDRLDGLVADRGACIPGSPLSLHGEDVPEPALHHLVRSPAREVRSPADRGYNLRLMASEVGVVLSEDLLALCLAAPAPCAQLETPQGSLPPSALPPVPLHSLFSLSSCTQQTPPVPVGGDPVLRLPVQVGIVDIVRTLQVVPDVDQVDSEGDMGLTTEQLLLPVLRSVEGVEELLDGRGPYQPGAALHPVVAHNLHLAGTASDSLQPSVEHNPEVLDLLQCLPDFLVSLPQHKEVVAATLDKKGRHQPGCVPHQAIEGGNFVQVSEALNCLGELEEWSQAEQIFSLEELEKCSTYPIEDGRAWSRHQFSFVGSK